MQLTIDSTEPLEKVLGAVGGLYGVRLLVDSGAVGAPQGGAAAAVGGEPRKRANVQPRAAKKVTARRGAASAKRAAPRRPRASTLYPADVRVWALTQGLPVATRGRINREIAEAYRRAHA